MRARQQAVEDLQADRNLPVHLLTELVKQMPDGVYIVSMRQDNQTVTLQGVAQSNERVSELLRNLANNTPWFSKPELVEIVAGTVDAGAAGAASGFQFHHPGAFDARQRGREGARGSVGTGRCQPPATPVKK